MITNLSSFSGTTNSFKNESPNENIQSIDEIEDAFFEDVIQIFDEVLDKKLTRDELETLFKKIISITKKQVEVKLHEFRSDDFSPIINDQFCQAQLPFMNNIFPFTSSYINLANFQPNFAPQQLINPNSIGNNFYLQQQQQLINNQQYFFKSGQIHPIKKKAKITKSIKKKKMEQKSSKHKSKKSNSNTINSFNNLSFKKQNSVISDLIESNPKLKVLKKLEKLFVYIQKFNPKADENYISITSKEDNNEIPLKKGMKNLEQIELSHNSTRLFETNKVFNSDNFLNQLKNFEHVLIEIKYPSPTFDEIYSRVLEIKRKESNRIRIGIFITGVSESDMKFRKNEDIFSVKFDKTVTTIKGGACMHNSTSDGGSFRGCSSLHQVFIPNSVTTIGENSFKECVSLRSISIPSSVVQICSGAFVSCKSLEKVTFVAPSSLSTIELAAFSLCSSLKEIEMPPSVKSIGKWAFNECTSLTQVVIPNSVKVFAKNVFKKCTSLKQIKVPSFIETFKLGVDSKVEIIRT